MEIFTSMSSRIQTKKRCQWLPCIKKYNLIHSPPPNYGLPVVMELTSIKIIYVNWKNDLQGPWFWDKYMKSVYAKRHLRALYSFNTHSWNKLRVQHCKHKSWRAFHEICLSSTFSNDVIVIVHYNIGVHTIHTMQWIRILEYHIITYWGNHENSYW